MIVKWKYRPCFICSVLCYLWTADNGGLNDNRQWLKNKNLTLLLLHRFHSALALFSHLLKMSQQSSICIRTLPPRLLLWIWRKECMSQGQSIMTASETRTMRFFKPVYTIPSIHVSLFCFCLAFKNSQNSKYFCNCLSTNLIPPPSLYPSCSSLLCKRQRKHCTPNWAHVQQKCEPLGILFTPH